MEVGIFSPVFWNLSLEDSLKRLNELSVSCLELGCGGYPGKKHADAGELVKSPKKVRELKDLFEKYGIKIAALSAHGNPVHPDKKTAEGFHNDFLAACELAGMLGVERVVGFSGCPGDGKGDKPNWVTCPWPNDFSDILKYQWEDILIPYWEKTVTTAKNFGVKYICLEMHPGFCVYNPPSLLRLREAAGEMICANLDPSHLIWQGIDPAAAVRFLGRAVQFVHAKDTELYPANVARSGVLDTGTYGNISERSWLFRTVGFGTGELAWKKFVSALSIIGYNGVLSIEHEDSLIDPSEGLEKAVAFLKGIVIKKPNTASWWT